MDIEKRTEYIKTRLSEKGIDEETQSYVLKYVDTNQQLFGNALDIDKVVERLLNNLNYSIENFDIKKNPLKALVFPHTSLGAWSPYKNKIEMNPILKMAGKFSKSMRQKYDSTIMHELDHCATTEYIDMSEEDKKYFTERIPIKNQKLKNIFKNIINKKIEERKGQIVLSGIAGVRNIEHARNNGVSTAKLALLNEGITAYKEEKYNRFLGIEERTSYDVEKTVASFIGKVIGEDELIRLHSNNDYQSMRVAFQKETGRDLNEIVGRLKETSLPMRFAFGNLYARNYKKNMEKIIKEITQSSAERAEKKAEFIPRCEIDHNTAIAKVMEESQSPTHAISSETEKEFND